MKTSDPILNHFKVVSQRVLLFIFLATLVSAGVWAWLLLGLYDLSTQAALIASRAALPTVTNRTGAIMLVGCGVIGLLTVSNFYTLVGWWWSRRADVHHRRGAQLTDRR
jgi:multisubunit Na+/H+ antiporter MnhB subunit